MTMDSSPPPLTRALFERWCELHTKRGMAGPGYLVRYCEERGHRHGSTFREYVYDIAADEWTQHVVPEREETKGDAPLQINAFEHRGLTYKLVNRLSPPADGVDYVGAVMQFDGEKWVEFVLAPPHTRALKRFMFSPQVVGDELYVLLENDAFNGSSFNVLAKLDLVTRKWAICLAPGCDSIKALCPNFIVATSSTASSLLGLYRSIMYLYEPPTGNFRLCDAQYAPLDANDLHWQAEYTKRGLPDPEDLPEPAAAKAPARKSTSDSESDGE